MITLHFSTAFDHGVYPPPSSQNLRPNERFVGIKGLLHVLERELGLTGLYDEDSTRVLRYHRALKTYLEQKSADQSQPFFGESFKADELGVAQELLSWRDELVLGGWEKLELNDLPPRLRTLFEVEQLFKQADCIHFGLSDRWVEVFRRLDHVAPAVDKLYIYEPVEWLHPFFKLLFEEKLGEVVEPVKSAMRPVQGNYNLALLQRYIAGDDASRQGNNPGFDPLKNDASVVVIEARDEYLAADFLANQVKLGYNPLVINHGGASLDHSLAATGLSVPGSVMENANPQITQLFKLATSGLFWPVNVLNLLSFLQMPYLPFDKRIARQLARKLQREGGLANGNERWNTEAALKELPETDPKEEKALDIYLNFPLKDTQEVPKIKIQGLYEHLKNWASQMYGRKSQAEGSALEAAQFRHLRHLCENILLALDGAPGDQLTQADFQQMQEKVYQPGRFKLYEAQVGSLAVVDNPGSILSPAGQICWMNFHGESLKARQQAFLLQSEIEQLRKTPFFLYDSTSQTQLQLEAFQRGILAAREKLVLIKPSIVQGEPVTPHPLEGYLDSLDVSPVVLTVDQFDSWGDHVFEPSTLDTPAKVQLPEPATYWKDLTPIKDWHTRIKESPSSLGVLIQYPFDYVVKYLAGIDGERSLLLPELFIQKGNVAHRAVELLLKPFAGKAFIPLEKPAIKQALDEAVVEKGLAFLLPDNHFEFLEMQRQFLVAFDALQQIMVKNDLRVEGVELEANAKVDGIGELGGRIDLYLSVGSEPKNKLVIDLKWALSEKKYKEQIEENRDMQLALYYALLMQSAPSSNLRTGFFLFNAATLFTRADLEGPHIIKVDAEGRLDENQVIEKVIDSIAFRRREFQKGIIEMGEGFKLNELDYVQQPDLIPLEEATGKKKKENPYTDFKLFKGTIK